MLPQKFRSGLFIFHLGLHLLPGEAKRVIERDWNQFSTVRGQQNGRWISIEEFAIIEIVKASISYIVLTSVVYNPKLLTQLSERSGGM